MTARFVWWDLMTIDVEKSAPFFAALLDCDILQAEDEPSYFMLAPAGSETPIFGFVPISPDEGVTSHWMGYAAVPDLNATMARAPELGGVIGLGSEDLGEDADQVQLQFGIVTDPQGAVFALMKDEGGGAPPIGDEVPGLGQVSWIELLAANRDVARAFYTDLFGWEAGPEHYRPDEGMAHALFADSEHGRVFGFLRDQPRGSPMPSNWCYFLRVADLDQAIVKARELGGFIYEDPAVVDGGRRVIMLDPTGAPVALWQVG